MMFPYIQKMTEIETNYTNFTRKHNFPRMLCIMKTWMTHTEEGIQTHNNFKQDSHLNFTN